MLLKMNVQTFSRAYLLGIPAEIKAKAKQQSIDSFVAVQIRSITNAAAAGMTSYVIETDSFERAQSRNQIQWMQNYQMLTQSPGSLDKVAIRQRTGDEPPIVSIDELVAGIQLKFPDCSVKYDETWLDSGPGSKRLVKGIVVDWS